MANSTSIRDALAVIPEKEKEEAKPSSVLAKTQEYYITNLSASLEQKGIALDAEQVSCARSCIATMNSLCVKQGIRINDVDQLQLAITLERVCTLRINLSAVPAEGYMIIRRQKNGQIDVNSFEFGIQGNGYDKLVRQYGVDVKKVYPFWLVREGDDFTYPSFNGIDVTPPTWTPKSYCTSAIRVVYPIEYNDGSVQYYIAERDGCVVNLRAHILNNIKMKPSAEMSMKYKDDIKAKMANMSLSEILSDPDLMRYVGPAYKNSLEGMIVRKMRNNALKSVPLDFGNAYLAEAFNAAVDDAPQANQLVDVLDADVTESMGTVSNPMTKTMNISSEGMAEKNPNSDVGRPF